VCMCVCMCVDDVVRLSVEPWRGCKFLILDEELKIEFIGIIKGRKQFGANFCETCVCFDSTHSSFHMAQM